MLPPLMPKAWGLSTTQSCMTVMLCYSVFWKKQVFSYRRPEGPSQIAGLRRSLEARARQRFEGFTSAPGRPQQTSKINMMGMPQTPSGGLKITLMTSQSKLVLAS